MKLLLDHCMDRQFARLLPGHEVWTAAARGWDGLKNGALLLAAAGEAFDALLTIDQNLRYQQAIDRLPVTVIEINSRDTRLAALSRLAPLLPAALEAARDYRFVSMSEDGRIDRLSPRTRP